MTQHVGGRRRGNTRHVDARRRGVVALLIAAALVLVGGCTSHDTQTGPTLIVRDSRTGQELYQRSVEVGERFRLAHNHSVTRRTVVETFSVLDTGTIAMDELWFDRHGANLPTGPETIDGVTTTYLEESDGYRVLHHRRPIGSVPLIVGSELVDHVLIFEDGQRIHLLHITDQWSRVDVIVEPDGGAAAGGR